MLFAAFPVAAQQNEPLVEQRLKIDWAWMTRYQAENAALSRDRAAPRIVFVGDSITQMWRDAKSGFFTDGRIDRGIGGQTTPQMLVRFRQDVIDLRPDVVQIMAGTNDIASNTGPMTDEQTEANLQTMVELAYAHHIRVILASIPPASHFAWRPGLEVTHRIARINAWIRAYAARSGAIYADYWSVLNDGQGGFRPEWTIDGVHPSPAGFDVMVPVAMDAIARARALHNPRPTADTRQ
ncbi:GDSL-type esterase/lipase family protein [Sphingomonas sp. BAUL-RG-20F-R05-02]|uniref:GDSL-type esterase/lipase family protein n=1 Tax=Sphingomonas sp. BAUL-RG-20F-R05-02 TaxID=2914830 RepID=UPI001F561A2A|nr:GDSL-type esterase/lipase family protein [Sphingomonas sp. BAUL-RG-20F-R05-02]